MVLLPRTPDMASVPAIVLTRPSPRVAMSSSSSTYAPPRPRVNPLSALGFALCSECPESSTSGSMVDDPTGAGAIPPLSSSADVPAATIFTLSNPFSAMSFTPLEKPRLTQELLLPAPSMLRRKKRQQDLKWTVLALVSAGLWIWAMFDYGILHLDGVVAACGLDRFIAPSGTVTHYTPSGNDRRATPAPKLARRYHAAAAAAGRSAVQQRRSLRRALVDSSYPTGILTDMDELDSQRPDSPAVNTFVEISHPNKPAHEQIIEALRSELDDDLLEDIWDTYTIDTTHELGYKGEEHVDWANMILDDVAEDAPRA